MVHLTWGFTSGRGDGDRSRLLLSRTPLCESVDEPAWKKRVGLRTLGPDGDCSLDPGLLWLRKEGGGVHTVRSGCAARDGVVGGGEAARGRGCVVGSDPRRGESGDGDAERDSGFVSPSRMSSP